MRNDKIFALSSGAGKSGIAVVRLSGENLLNDFKRIINKKTDIIPRHFYMANITNDNDELIDNCMAVFFNSPHSFTGDDIIEIYPHGSPAVIDKLFEFLKSINYRIAAPGEFSQRAFYNGKMDLSEIDGLVALLDAKTDKQRTAALKSMAGNDSEIYKNWREQMIELSAYSAAILDYSDDELPGDIKEKIAKKAGVLRDEIKKALEKSDVCNAITNGFKIVLTGDVNVGKSSIFNRFVGKNRAIVSDVCGTTRDVIDTELNLGGYLVNLSDTAGIRESDDEIEKIGIEKSFESVRDADLILRVYANEIRDIEPPRDNEIIVFNKCDIRDIKTRDENAICISAQTGKNFEKLIQKIIHKIEILIQKNESELMVNARTKQLLEKTSNELDNALKHCDVYDLFSDHLNTAANNIGKILGIISPEEIMDATFNRLCLGK